MAKMCVFHIESVPFSESDAKGCVRLYKKDVDNRDELIRQGFHSEDKGEFIGNFWNARDAKKKVHELAKPYNEFTTYEG